MSLAISALIHHSLLGLFSVVWLAKETMSGTRERDSAQEGKKEERKSEHRSSHRSSHRSHHSSRSHKDHGHHRSSSHRSSEREHRKKDDRDNHSRSREHRQRERSPRRYESHTSNTSTVTQSDLNELNAKTLKAKLRQDPILKSLEEQYESLKMEFYSAKKFTDRANNATLTGTSKRDFAIEGKKEDDMTPEELLQQERMTSGMDRSAIATIMKDKKYSTDLDYQDENSSKLAQYVQKGVIDLKKMETSQAKKLSDALDRCQLCIENESICCDMLSMGNNSYLTLPPSPEIAKYSAMIVPINHVKSTLYCDEDEWEEIRNYMISLSTFYYEKLNKSVVFYETSIYKYNHAAIVAVPIPMSLASTVQGYFKQAIIEQTMDLEEQNKSIIDTLAKSSTMGRDAFRHLIAREAPFFHVWFSLNGGIGHIVEDVSSWPKGDLFAREVLGGLLRVDPLIVRKQGRWKKDDPRVLDMSTIFKDYDWAEKLLGGSD